MTSTAWNTRNSGRFEQQRNSNSVPSVSGHVLSKSPSSSRPGRSSSIFSFGNRRTNPTQITPFTPTSSDPTGPQQPLHSSPVPEQHQGTNNDLGPPQHAKRPSLVTDTPSMNPALVIQREIKSVVDLVLAQAHKIYYSGPLTRRIERLADGNKPALDEGWVDVWAQLGGTTLSVWDMKAIEEASKRGEEVPPSYINITDCFVQVLGALTSPATPTSPSKRYTNVITINTAGSNLIFFACPSSAALVAWATSIRLAGWEKSRLEEIYTGHLLRMTLSDNGTWSEPPRTSTRSRLEGFVKARISGHTEWKSLWLSLSLSTEYSSEEHIYRSNSPVTSTTRSKNRVSTLFSRNHHNDTQPTGPAIPVISFYASPKPKDRKKPLLTMRNVTQAYAVYPERPEVIQKSTLIKIEGHLGTEDIAGPMKGRECWIMIMPETQQAFPVLELVRWLIAIHDLYNLYGRPNSYVWDPRQPLSLWFGYPVGPQREHLFVSREEAERLDPRDDRTSSIRTQLTEILIQRMYSSNLPASPGKPSEPNWLQAQAQQPSVGQARSSPPPHSTSPPPAVSPPASSLVSPPASAPPPPPVSPRAPPPASTPPPPPPPVVSPRAPAPAASATAAVDFSPAQNQERQLSISETQSVSASRSVGSPPRSQPATAREATSASPPRNPPLSTSPEPLDVQSINSIRQSYTAAASLGSYTSQSQISSDETHPGREPVVPPTNQGQFFSRLNSNIEENGRVTKSFPRQDSVTSSNVSYTNTSPTGFQQQQHSATLPLHPRVKSPQAISPPRSPPLPPTPQQIFTTTEIKQPTPLSLANVSSPVATDINDLASEPAALFVLQENAARQESKKVKEPKNTWSQSEDDEEEEEEEEGGENDLDFTGSDNNLPARRLAPGPPSAYKHSNGENSARGDGGGGNTRVRTSVGRKPSGARVRPGSGLVRLPEFDTQPSATSLNQMNERSELPYDDTVDALAALNFLESQGFDDPSPSNPPPSKVVKAPVADSSASQINPSQESEPPAPSNEAPQFRSSFALSKQAVERHAKVQAQQEARHQPGKPKTNGGAKPVIQITGWPESSDEEEEEEDEEEEEEYEISDDDASPKPAPPIKSKQSVPDVRTSVYPSAQPNASKEGMAHSRFLPQPPNNGDPNRGIGEDRRRPSAGDEPRTHGMNPHLFARQSVWSSVLDPTPPPPKLGSGNRNTFVQVDESETMTKAFQPQGLLSAGLQDKEERSAKRQEEHARESGGSLINVPSKPPPPQSGLLGAITAHERERKREGGVGAALTERERERRLAEERQRKLDELQRQQLDQMSQQGGMGNPYEMYGQQGFPGFMPQFDPRMSMNPMMFNPMMGFPGMQFGNPQQNFAAMMAAQQAYQQAMISFSQAGSQAGDTPANPNAGPTTPLHPQMTGMSGMQPMMGMDPRMSMVFNPWMMNPGAMGMGMNLPGMANMNMNSPGGLDPRMGSLPAINRQDSAGAGLGPSSHGTPSPRQNSPAPPRSSNNSPLAPPQL